MRYYCILTTTMIRACACVVQKIHPHNDTNEGAPQGPLAGEYEKGKEEKGKEEEKLNKYFHVLFYFNSPV